MRSLLFVALLLTGCGDVDEEALTKAVEAASKDPSSVEITDGTCPELDPMAKPQPCDR